MSNSLADDLAYAGVHVERAYRSLNCGANALSSTAETATFAKAELLRAVELLDRAIDAGAEPPAQN